MGYVRKSLSAATAVVSWIGVVSGCFSHQAVIAKEVPKEVFIRYSLEVYYRSRYKTRPDYRAIAVGPHGVWLAAYGKLSKLTAEKVAIAGCQKRLKKARLKSIRKRKCYLYAVGDQIVFKGKLPELPFGTVLKGEDLPLKRALYNRSPKGKAVGILLFLHGCNRLRSMPQLYKRWFRHFLSKGFRIIAPNSFAERRPPQQCAHEIRRLGYRGRRRRAPTIARVVRLRVAQTYRTLRNIQERYPGLPIVVWGHSEGGAIAQLVSARVAGIIASGIECGIRGVRDLLVREDVPLLVLIGSKDPFIRAPKKKTPDNVRNYCNPIFRSIEWNFVYLKGVGHSPSFKNRTARQAIDTFITPILKRHAPRPRTEGNNASEVETKLKNADPDTVIEWQRYLKIDDYYDGSLDGKYGKKTSAAVQKCWLDKSCWPSQ